MSSDDDLILTNRGVTTTRYVDNTFKCSERDFISIAILIERIQQIFDEEISSWDQIDHWTYSLTTEHDTELHRTAMESLRRLREAYEGYFPEQYNILQNVPLIHFNVPMVLTKRGLEFGLADQYEGGLAHHVIIYSQFTTIDVVRLVSIDLNI